MSVLVLQALIAAGTPPSDPVIGQALGYLDAAQNSDGGFPGFDGLTSTSSTGLALQALAAYHETPRSLGWTKTITDGTASGLTLNNPVDALLRSYIHCISVIICPSSIVFLLPAFGQPQATSAYESTSCHYHTLPRWPVPGGHTTRGG